MASRKGGAHYDDDDYDDADYYDDGDYDEYDEPAPPPRQQPAKKAAPSIKPTASQPSAPSSKAAALRAQPYPLAPQQADTQGVQPFDFATPSPDDRVLAARAGRAGHGPAAPVATQQGAVAAAASGVAAMSISGGGAGPQPAAAAASSASAGSKAGPAAQLPSRPLEDYRMEADMLQACARAAAAEASGQGDARPRLHLVVLGHVDAGKSTLIGRLLHDLGRVDSKTAHKNQREASAAGKGSFAWAWVLDERPEERARGVTVDIAQARFDTQRFAVTLLDAPGHQDFVPNMISGAAQADAALLLVDASPGGFEAGFEEAPAGMGSLGGGQTREHAQLARSLGVEQLAVVVSKLDVCEYDQQRYEHIRAQLLPFLKACGFRESCIQWLPAVGPQGENLVQPPKDPRLASWWRGPTLVQAVDGFRPGHRAVERPLRLPVSDVFKHPRGGIAVGGKVEGGALSPGCSVRIMPSGVVGQVKSLEVDGKQVQLARAGDSVDVVLAGVDPLVLSPGVVLCPPDWPVPLARRLQARIVVLDCAVPLLQGHQVTLHVHMARQSGSISRLVCRLDAKTGEVVAQRPRCLLKGQSALVEVTPLQPLCVERYADYRQLGRLALREGGRTLAVGVVTEVQTE